MDSSKKMETIDWLAQRLGVQRPRAYEYARRRLVPGIVRLGRRVLVNPDAVEDWIARQSQAQ